MPQHFDVELVLPPSPDSRACPEIESGSRPVFVGTSPDLSRGLVSAPDSCLLKRPQQPQRLSIVEQLVESLIGEETVTRAP
jgi:hypothetical protein